MPMSKVTIFSAPKPFSDPHIKIIQRNAVRSWKLLGPEAEIFLIGDETGILEEAGNLGVGHIPNVEKNNFGTPLVSSIFSLARQASTSNLLIYLNADIILLPEMLEIIYQVNKLKKEFLIVGRRWDLDINSEIVFNSGWSNEIKISVAKEGKLQGSTAMDYFVFPKHLFQEIPPFAVGRAGWDNWMIFHGMQQPWPVIDVTPTLMVIHQNHDYSHLPGGKPHFNLDESSQNVDLGGGYTKSLDLLDVRREFRGGEIRNVKFSLPSGLRRLERCVNPQIKEGWRWELTRKIRKLRRRLS